ncbi:mechanosensitive ion channel family protein [Nodosilinea sp. E11]|uniref:mechanosensitive ion channel family protein n=1 Tax=Nodosilinea sp. E11 TaxID=3037479 RepID=UPI0029347236|nr:mechanosensitive ion channel family protein [Nodosilinea sp. E11]WOD39856.1 mechanosensitive ion channel family protein [Nodosilinea sp. E11]
MAATSVVAQFFPLPTPEGSSEILPVDVERRGTLESAGVQLDGQVLFRIASPMVVNRAEVGTQMPVEVRARQIESNLQRLFPDRGATSAQLDPETLQVVIEPIDNYPVLFVRDAGLAEARVLLTVTNTDAQYHATSETLLAEQWQSILDQELRQALMLRQPEVMQQQLMTTVQVLAATLGLTLVLWLIRLQLGRYQNRLYQRKAAESALFEAHHQTRNNASAPDQTSPLGQGAYYHFQLERQLHGVRLVRWLLFWGTASLWALATAYSLNLFPQTRQFARTIVLAPVVILFTWFVVGLIDKLIDLGVDRFIQKFAKGQPLTSTNLQRINTIAQVIKGVKMVVVYIVGLIWVLQWLNLIPGSVLALGTLVALVISFAAQNLVKDLVNGFLILIEDQFRIGDVVIIGDIDGFVENLNLRITQLRNPQGQLITLPNSSITHVRNLTRHWSRATLDFEVAYNTDINRALAVVRETADQMAQDPQWQPLILDTHEFFGVQQISHTGIVIQIWIKTIPLKQWLVSMEFRRRVKIAFDQHHIQIGAPRQIWLQEDPQALGPAQQQFYSSSGD